MEKLYDRKNKSFKTSNKLNQGSIANFQYLREFYLKDFKYISPTMVNMDKMEKGRRMEKDGSCRMLLRVWLKDMMEGLRQFLYQGSLHGVKYIFEPSFSRKERIIWIIIVLASILICACVIIQLFSKSNSTPFVNVIDSLPTPVWAVPFPAVVVCPHLHLQLSRVNVSELDELHTFFASRICPQMVRENRVLDQRFSPENNQKMMDFIVKGSPKCTEIVKNCYWRGTNQLPKWMTTECCESYFRPLFTNYGLCFTFNGLPLNGMTNMTIPWQKTFTAYTDTEALQWGLDKGYPKVVPSEARTLPHRVMASGEANGLGVELYLNVSERQFACDGNSLGFNVIIGSPTNHVYTSTVLRLPMDRMTTIEVSPITYKTDSNLRSLSPDTRQCFFQNERKLVYYEFYTDTNCKHDLLMREAARRCQCVLFNWPRTHLLQPICSTALDFQCVDDVRATVERQLIDAYFDDSEEQRKTKSSSTSCHPSCNDILYSSQVFYSDWIKEPEDAQPYWGHTTSSGEITKLNVHFYNDMFLGQHRHMQYDDYYFVGAIGGLLSLFLGFSIISVAELLYFVILRPIHTLCNQYFC